MLRLSRCGANQGLVQGLLMPEYVEWGKTSKTFVNTGLDKRVYPSLQIVELYCFCGHVGTQVEAVKSSWRIFKRECSPRELSHSSEAIACFPLKNHEHCASYKRRRTDSC